MHKEQAALRRENSGAGRSHRPGSKPSLDSIVRPQCLFQLHAQLQLVAERVSRIARLHDVLKPGLHRTNRFGMAVDLEPVGGQCVKYLLSHVRCAHLAGTHRLVAHGLADQLAAARLGHAGVLWAVAVALADAGGHKEGAQHRGVNLVGDQGQSAF